MTERGPWFAALREQATDSQMIGVRAVIDGGLLLALLDIAEAASHPFLVTLESHPKAEPVANAEMKRAADRLRAALSSAAHSHDSGESAAEGAAL